MNFTLWSWFAHALRSWAVTALALVLNAASGLAWSMQGDVRLLDADLQLRVEAPNFATTVHVPPGRAQPVRINIQTRRSEWIDVKRSVVHLLVNGQVRSSRRLSQLDSGPWVVQLRPLPAGAHALEVRTELRASEDACDTSSTSLWLTVLSASTLSGASMLAPANSARVVRDFPGAWKKAPTAPTRMDGSASSAATHPSVVLQSELPADAAHSAGFLRLQLHLAAQGLSITSTGSNATAARLTVRPLTHAPADPTAQRRLSVAPDATYIWAVADSQTLVLWVRDAQALESAIDLLASTDWRAICHEAVCSAPANALPAAAQAPAGADPMRLWHLGESELSSGWTASGAGRHTMRQIWGKPAGLRVGQDAVLELFGRASHSADLNAAKSNLTIKLNDVPLGTVSPNDRANRSFRIPAALAARDVWVIDFEVELIATDSRACSAHAKSGLWWLIEPTTRVTASVRDSGMPSVLGFWRASTHDSPLPIVWQGGGALFPTQPEIVPFLPVLSALNALPASGLPRRWQWVPASDCEQKTCLMLHPQAQSTGQPLAWQNVLNELPTWAKNLPHLAHIDAAVLAAQRPNAQAWHLHAFVHAQAASKVNGEPKAERLAVPDLHNMTGPIAAYADRWHVLQRPPVASHGSEAASAAAPMLDAQTQRLRWLNLVWAALSMALVAAIALWLWRRKRAPDARTWEVR